jgi:hypothetical protein
MLAPSERGALKVAEWANIRAAAKQMVALRYVRGRFLRVRASIP